MEAAGIIYPDNVSPTIKGSINLLIEATKKLDEELVKLISYSENCEKDKRPKVRVLLEPSNDKQEERLVDAGRLAYHCLAQHYFFNMITKQDEEDFWDELEKEFQMPISGFGHKLEYA